MQEAQPIVQALAATHCIEETSSHQSPSKRKTRLQSQSKQDNSSSQTTPTSRYTRSQAAPDWTVQEVLVLLSEIVAIDEAWLKELSSYQRWKMISDSCMTMSVVRSSNQCKRKWEMLLDEYNKIMDWESKSSECSYWFLPEEKRKENGLPVSFQKEVFDAMNAVVQVEQQQSDSTNSDPERIISAHELETSKMNANSEISVLDLPNLAHEEEELVTTSKCPEESNLKSPEKVLVLAGDELITTSKSPEVAELMKTTSKISEERLEIVDLNTISNNLIDRPEVEEELVTMSEISERLELEELNTTSKSLGKIPEVDELMITLKSAEVEDLITASKCADVEDLITTSKIPVMAASAEEELITTSKSSEKASVITVFEQEELITNSKSSGKARLITSKLQENAEHVCAILSGELQDGASPGSLPTDSLKQSVSKTQFARHQADELIKALAELTTSLDELCDHIDRRGCAANVSVDSMA